MGRLFEEIDSRDTPIGLLSLRRRRELKLDVDVFEIKLGEEFLMSSLFTASEIALAELGLAELDGTNLDVIVGGLGLGYTAQAALADGRVSALTVVEYLDAVIAWHREGLLPLGPELTADPRCCIQEGDFFALAASEQGFDPQTPGRRYDAILLDIDHSPEALLDARSESFYRPEGLRALARHLKPGGVFGLWSNDAPDDRFSDRLAGVFAESKAAPVSFHNPLQEREVVQTVYLARCDSGSQR
ncbi:MAG: spermidine synthase [Rhodovibrionaceae bacterium]